MTFDLFSCATNLYDAVFECFCYPKRNYFRVFDPNTLMISLCLAFQIYLSVAKSLEM